MPNETQQLSSAMPASGAQHADDSNHEQLMSRAKFTQQVIEQKERELQESIFQNYQRIKDVEKELVELQLQVKLTAEPKKHAMEVLRKKIEIQGNKVAAVRKRYTAAKQAFEDLEAELNHEESLKQQLCDELNQLVTTSVSSQLERFEQLKSKLESLQGGGTIGRSQSAPAAAAGTAVAGTVVAAGANALSNSNTSHSSRVPAGEAAAGPLQNGNSSSSSAAEQMARAANGTEAGAGAAGELPVVEDAAAQAAAAEQQRLQAAAAVEAAAARSRHVQLTGRSSRLGPQGRGGSQGSRVAAVESRQSQQLAAQQSLDTASSSGVAVEANGRFAGFDA